ncbi:cycloartenol-C-24-methyltransferase [Citrus sinensis]|nr:cycloartenol-C-24-methyltransferase [Citrus sinensis]
MLFGRHEQIQGDLKKLENPLVKIKAVLDCADKKQTAKRSVKILLVELQNLAYDVEDMLDELATEALRRNVVHWSVKQHRSKVSFNGYSIFQILNSIGDLKLLWHLDLADTEIEILPNSEAFDARKQESKEVLGHFGIYSVPDRYIARMSKAGAFDLASGVGGKIDKTEVLSAVEKYEKYHVCYGGEEEERKANYTDMVNKYYDLVTSFYEFGWGESFHFAPRWKGESLQESIKRHEHFLALQLGLKSGQKVLDVGCGIGGPLREIARFSSTSVTGLNNNEYQITRGKELNRFAGVDKTCNFVKADFMKMPFPDNSFDAVYAIEATCHAPDAYGCYKEIYRVLKPGQCFAAYEWCLTDAFDPNNQEHKKIKVIWEKDLAPDSPLPWYLPLDTSHFSLSSFRLTSVGRFVTRNMVKALEFVGLAPKGSQRVQDFLEKAAEGLVAGGRKEIFTPMYFFLARKPQHG